MELFRFIFPKSGICNEEELYFRTVPSSGYDNSVTYNEQSQEIKLKKGALISFDTYFNCFSYSKYLKYTWVDCVGISLRITGKFLVRLFAARHESESLNEVLQEHRIESSEISEFKFTHNFTSDRSEGIYYIELTALSDEAVFLVDITLLMKLLIRSIQSKLLLLSAPTNARSLFIVTLELQTTIYLVIRVHLLEII